MGRTTDAMIQVARSLCAAVDGLSFAAPVSHIYNPLNYAWPAHEQYLRLAAASSKQVVFLGMNPGPFGMVQTGVPFGEVTAVRDWMKLNVPIGKPQNEHPKRPVDGMACPRSEVSGRRLWGFFKDRFGAPKEFFKDHFVANHCPLAFIEDTGRNRTPDKLPAAEGDPLMGACDAHLQQVIEILKPKWLVAVGGYAEKRAHAALAGSNVQIGKILHPSPASPAANRGWAEQAAAQMKAQGIW